MSSTKSADYYRRIDFGFNQQFFLLSSMKCILYEFKLSHNATGATRNIKVNVIHYWIRIQTSKMKKVTGGGWLR